MNPLSGAFLARGKIHSVDTLQAIWGLTRIIFTSLFISVTAKLFLSFTGGRSQVFGIIILFFVYSCLGLAQALLVCIFTSFLCELGHAAAFVLEYNF